MWVAEMSNDVPGPGSYDWKYPELTRELTFGVPLKARTNEGPSPNAYEIKDGIGTSSSHIRASVPAWGIRSRTFFGSYYYEPIKAAGPGTISHIPLILHLDYFLLAPTGWVD